jgi:predicted MarR family transcription regulator
MNSTGMSSVDYRLLERWEAAQRWRRRARERDASDDGVEELLTRALRHLDRRRAETDTAVRRIDLDDR